MFGGEIIKMLKDNLPAGSFPEKPQGVGGTATIDSGYLVITQTEENHRLVAAAIQPLYTAEVGAVRRRHNPPLLWTGPRRVDSLLFCLAVVSASRCPPQNVIRYTFAANRPDEARHALDSTLRRSRR